jgi:hypothetical protein
VNEARSASCGYPSDPSVNKYARELTPAPAASPDPTPADDAAVVPPAVAARMNGNGNGKSAEHEEVEAKAALQALPDITIANAPQPVNIALTIEAPRAGTAKKSGTMTKDPATGEYTFTTTETPETPIGSPTPTIEDAPNG